MPGLGRVFLFVLSVTAVIPFAADAGRIGKEFPVNKSTPDYEGYSSVAALKDGMFVVVWEAQGDQDGSGTGVYGQRFNADGTKVGNRFRVNTTTYLNQRWPVVSGLSDGSFVVAWFSQDQDPETDDENASGGIYAQRFSSSGKRRGSEFRVHTTTAGNQGNPSIAALANRKFVIVWDSPGDEGDILRGVYGQRFSRTGKKLGSEFLVNTTTFLSQADPDVAGLNGNGFVVVWTSGHGTNPGISGLYGQRFGENGGAIGDEFRIDTTTNRPATRPEVAVLGNGGFVVAWESLNQDDTPGYGVYARRFLRSGVAAGGEFPVNSTVEDDQRYPTAAGLTNKGFVILWESESQDGTYGQRFSKSGGKSGGEFRASRYDQYYQFAPAVAGLPSRRFVATWGSSHTTNPGAPSDVYGQRFK